MRWIPFTAVVAAVALTGCAADDGDQVEVDAPAAVAEDETAMPAVDVTPVTLVDPDGTEVGTAVVRDVDGVLEMHVAVTGMPPGFHGLHVHAVGLCQPDSPDPADPDTVGDFLSAGGHLAPDEADHGAHGGDLPSLLVTSDGDGHLTVRTDGVTLDDLLDDDGSALMVHADPDNLAHIPERYAPEGPDEATLKTGDAGDRVACGVISD